MATEAKIGHGTIFAAGNSATPEVFINLGEITAITGPALVRDTVDATHMTSPEKWREFIPGLKDAGEISVTMNFVPGSLTETSIFGLFDGELPANYQMTFPNAEVWTFQAFCTGYDTETPLDDKMTATVAFKLTGKPAFFITGATTFAAVAGPTPSPATGAPATRRVTEQPDA